MQNIHCQGPSLRAISTSHPDNAESINRFQRRLTQTIKLPAYYKLTFKPQKLAIVNLH